jgi:transposase
VILFLHQGAETESCAARTKSGSLFSCVDLEARVAQNHPLRMIRRIVNEAVARLAGDFAALYSRMGRPSIPPEKAAPSDAAGSLLFDPLGAAADGGVWSSASCFAGLSASPDDAVWDHSMFSKNRDRLLEGDIAAKLLRTVLAQPRVKRLLSTDHSVDGTLFEAWRR